MDTPRRLRWRFRRPALAPLLAGVAGLLLVGGAARAVLVRRMLLPRLILRTGGNVTSVAVTPDGKTVLGGDDPTHEPLLESGNAPADVFVWDAASGRPVRRLHGLYWRASGVSVSPDGRRVLAAGYPSRDLRNHIASHMAAWDIGTGRALWTQVGNMPLCVSPDGRQVGAAVERYKKNVAGMDPVLLDPATGRSVRRIAAKVDELGQTGFTPDGALFGGIVAGHLDPVTGFADFDDGGKGYYATTRLHFWRADTGQEVKDFPFTRVRAWDLSRDGKWLGLVSNRDQNGMSDGSDGSVVRRVDFRTGAVAWTRERSMNGPDADPDAVLNSVAVSPNGKSIVVAGPNCHLIVLDAATGRERLRPFVFHSRDASGWAMPGGLAFSADGLTLVSRSGPDVLVWDAAALP